MIISSFIWIYYLLSNFLFPHRTPLERLRNEHYNHDSSDVFLSTAYGFSSGILDAQHVDQSPLDLVTNSYDGTIDDTEHIAFSDEYFTERAIRVKINSQFFKQDNDERIISIPAVDDYETVLSLAKISANAYMESADFSNARWYPVDPFLKEDGFGWDQASIRGYVYTTPSKNLVIMAIKGTSTAIFDGSGHTAPADKFNDNLMFSCCCARVDVSWDTVCPCYQNNFQCEFRCLSEYAKRPQSFPFKTTIISRDESNSSSIEVGITNIYPVYFYQAVKIYEKLRRDYPLATIWLTGHSLGGSLASLLAMKFRGTAAVAFSAPGERIFAERLGLIPRITKENKELVEQLLGRFPIYHIYNSADPIPHGRCSGVFSLCYIAGYAMESKCHVGRVCEYDIGAGKPYDLQKHKLQYMIEKVIMGGYPLPSCRVQNDCYDCNNWKFN